MRLFLTFATLCVGSALAGCGGGSGGGSMATPTATPARSGREAIATGAAAATSLAVLVEAILGDSGSNGTATRPPARYLVPSEVLLVRHLESGEGDEEQACPLGGAVRIDCRDSQGQGELSGEFADCLLELSESHLLRLNGRLELGFDSAICQHRPPAGEAFHQGRYRGLTTELIDRATEAVDESIRFDLDILLTAEKSGCAGPIGSLVLDGRLSLLRAPSGTSIEAELPGLAIELSDDSGAAPCPRMGQVTGTAVIDHHNLGRAFRLDLQQLRVAVETYSPLESDVSLAGAVGVDCAGAVEIETADPIHHGFFQGCADFGRLRLASADGTTGEVRFTDHGLVGFDFDGDGNYETGGDGCATLPDCTEVAR